MLGINQFQRADTGQQVLRMGSQFKVRGPGRLRLPDQIMNWLEDVYGGDELMVPAAVVRQFWTQPRYTDD
jgi:hypothetical protein